jgi:uncharacterized coiled-coil protein SlyX
VTPDLDELSRAELAALVAALEHTVAQQSEQLRELTLEVAALRLAAGKDSSNSGKPPSSDSPFVGPRAKPSAFGKKSGGGLVSRRVIRPRRCGRLMSPTSASRSCPNCVRAGRTCPGCRSNR